MNNQSQPTFFVSYPSRYDFQIQQLGEALRKSEIQVFVYPQDLDHDGHRLAAAIRRQANRPVVLGYVAGPEPTSFSEKAIANVIAGLENNLRDVIVLQLADAGFVPTTLEDFKLYDLAGRRYPAGFNSLVKDLGASGHRPVRAKARYSHVSGIFEVARPQSDMFAELKKQISAGSVDQKYLYWDVRAALRWQEIAELSTYMTAQSSMNLLAANVEAILTPSLEGSTSQNFSFINFGVGTGVKDYLILERLLRRPKTKVAYFPVDESLSMIQITIQSMQELISQYGDRLQIQYILDDFDNADRFRRYISEHERRVFGDSEHTRLLGFLGGSIGNFVEDAVLAEVKRLLGKPRDRLILGVEFVAGRSDPELVENYADERMKRFLYGPIHDIEGTQPGWEETFEYIVRAGNDGVSSVPGAKTIVGSVVLRSQPVQLFYASKYEMDDFERFLGDMGFAVEARFLSDEDPPRFGKYVLRRATL